MSQAPIGLFDSGVGGLTVLRAIHRTLPHESTLYFGDTARVPYGSKSQSVITRFSIEIAQFLLKKKIKLLVVACNTASAFSLAALQKQFRIPIVGVIVPGARAAQVSTTRKRIGVIGTEGTIESRAYTQAIHRLDKTISVWGQACPLIVPLVEEGWQTKPLAKLIVKDYLRPLLRQRIDTLVLGCTHYPLLKSVIRSVVGPRIQLIDSAEETALTVQSVLREQGLSSPSRTSKQQFYVSDSPEKFKLLGSRFLGQPIRDVQWVDIRNWK